MQVVLPALLMRYALVLDTNREKARVCVISPVTKGLAAK